MPLEQTDNSQTRFSGTQLMLAVGLAVFATALVTAWWVDHYLYAAMFEPTQLTESEQGLLDNKLAQLSRVDDSSSPPFKEQVHSAEGPLEPEPYSEDDASREIQLTERELNALIAKDAEMAKHVAIDLADDLVSVKLVVPVNEEMPLVGGNTLKLNFGVELSYAAGKPLVAMQGISLGGVPLPSAWWGDIKDINLVEEFGGPGGFWDQFAKGVQDLNIQDGQLRITLKE